MFVPDSRALFTPFTMYGTRYTICVIAIDRYMRIKHLQEYQAKFTVFWYRVMLASYALAVLFPSLTIVLSQVFEEPGWIPKLTVPINVIAFVLFVTLYTKSVIKLKQHTRSNQNLSNTETDIVKITKFYFILYLTSNLLLVAYNITSLMTKMNDEHYRKTKKLVFHVLNNLNPTLVGIINSFAIMKINRPIKQKLLSFTNRVIPHINQ